MDPGNLNSDAKLEVLAHITRADGTVEVIVVDVDQTADDT